MRHMLVKCTKCVNFEKNRLKKKNNRMSLKAVHWFVLRMECGPRPGTRPGRRSPHPPRVAARPRASPKHRAAWKRRQRSTAGQGTQVRPPPDVHPRPAAPGAGLRAAPHSGRMGTGAGGLPLPRAAVRPAAITAAAQPRRPSGQEPALQVWGVPPCSRRRTWAPSLIHFREKRGPREGGGGEGAAAPSGLPLGRASSPCGPGPPSTPHLPVP